MDGLIQTEIEAIDEYVGTETGITASDMAGANPPSRADRILWLKALAAAIATHQG